MEKKLNETTTQAHNPFAALMRAYETAHATGADTTAPLMALAVACAQSVLKKCADPQRKTATERESVSNSGLSPAMVALQRGIVEDYGKPGTPGQLSALREAMDTAWAGSYTEDGYISKKVDSKAADTADTLSTETLSDGGDLVNTAVVAILEQTEGHAAAGEGWLEIPYTIRKVNKKVLIRSDDTAAWVEETTTPIQEVYRAIRREVSNSRAVQTDPRNGYLYLEDMVVDPETNAADTIYRRLGKWADLGGYTTTGHLDAHGNARHGDYTADMQSLLDYESVLAALNLTDRQAKIVSLRMRGYGMAAIATYLGISEGGVYNAIKNLRKKCEAIGFTRGMWAEMNGKNDRQTAAQQTTDTAAQQTTKQTATAAIWDGHATTTAKITAAVRECYGYGEEYTANW